MSKTKQFKKIYIEILNFCNLNCKFCEKTKKEKRIMSIDEFQHIINQIKPYTDYIYLHVQGEPLLHPNLKEILEVAKNNDIYVNMTTNSTLLKDKLEIIKDSKAIRQINCSLQALQNSSNNKLVKEKEAYYNTIIDLINNNPDIYVSLRLWGNYNQELLNEQIHYFEETLNTKLNKSKLKDHVFFSFDEEFTWPSLDKPFNSTIGHCQAINQLAILCDGTVVPCCLDKDGIINLGNIYTSNLKEILASKRYQDIIDNFKKNIVNEELCKHCTFLNRFK